LNLAPAPAARHVILVRSSLQFLLATALAADRLERSTQRSTMLFLPDVLDTRLFDRAVAAWDESPFDRVASLTPRRRPGSAERRASAVVRRELRSALAATDPLSVAVFNDRDEAAQTLLIEAAQRFPHAERLCVEDGALAYTGFTYRAHGLATRLRQRLRIGRSWTDVRVLGTHPLVQHYVAIYPELLRPELQQRRLRTFPATALSSSPLRSLAAAIAELTGFDAAAVPPGSVLLGLSHSSYAERNPDYGRLVKACAAQLRRGAARWFVKYHPRETAADPLGLLDAPNAIEVPRTLPVECLYLLLRDRPLTVVSGMSTSLLTAGLLMPQVRCVALLHASGAGDAWDRRLLDALRIVPLADARSLAAFTRGA
jgi:hypothetical protein